MERQRMTRQARRKAIVERARELFLSQGYEKTSMEQVAGFCGLSKGGLYYHFPDKEALFVETILQSSSNREWKTKQMMDDSAHLPREELILELLLEKIFDRLPDKDLYVQFLQQVRNNDRFSALYEYLYGCSKAWFDDFIVRMGVPELAVCGSREFCFFMNSLLLGLHLLPDAELPENRELARVLVRAFLTERGVFPLAKERQN